MQLPTCYATVPINLAKASKQGGMMRRRSSGLERSIIQRTTRCNINSQLPKVVAYYSTTTSRPISSILILNRRDHRCGKNHPRCPYRLHENSNYAAKLFTTSTDGSTNNNNGEEEEDDDDDNAEDDTVASSVAEVGQPLGQPPPQTLVSHWKNIVQRLIEDEEGSSTSQSWDEDKFYQARNALYKWARHHEEDDNNSNNHRRRVTTTTGRIHDNDNDFLSIEMMEYCWSLVERYCVEFEKSLSLSISSVSVGNDNNATRNNPHHPHPHAHHAIKDYLFSAVINQWRKFIHIHRHRHRAAIAIAATTTTTTTTGGDDEEVQKQFTAAATTPTPLEMISKLDKYRSNGMVQEMSVSPYNMTFNAMTTYYYNKKQQGSSGGGTTTKGINKYNEDSSSPGGEEEVFIIIPSIPEQAEAILDRLICDIINIDNNNSFSLDGTTTNVSTTTINNNKLLLIPDVVTFASVMKLWVLEGSSRRYYQSQASRRKAQQHAANRVLSLDKKRKDLSQKLNHPTCLEPTYIYKSIIIDALSQAGQALRAQTMLEEWCHECDNRDNNSQNLAEKIHQPPGNNATSQSSNPNKNVGDGNKMICEPPTMETFSTVVSAWSRSGHPRAAMYAENLLQRMIELHNNNDEGRDEGSSEKNARFNFRLDDPPNIVVYSNVLGCWAKSDFPHAAKRAETILRYLQENQRPECRPNVITYTSVIHAWAKRGNTERALSLLDEMIRQEDETVAPNDVTFNALLLSVKDPQQALGVLNEMHQLADTHPTWKCRPTVVTYGTVMQILAKAKLPHHARNLLDEMIEYHSSASTKKSMAYRKELPKPDTTTCNIVLHGYSKLGMAEEASSLLEEMHNARLLRFDPAPYKAEALGNASTLDVSIPLPDVVSFNSVLSAWSRSVDTSSTLSLQKAYNAALQAEQIFTRMVPEIPLKKDTHDPADSSKSSSIFDVLPTCVTYSTLLHCWSHVATALIESKRRGCEEDVNVTEADIVARCEALFKEMEDRHKKSINKKLHSDSRQIEDCKPNIVAYSNLFKVYATFGYHGTRIQEPLRDMKDIYSITPNAQWFVGLFNAWSHYCRATPGDEEEINGHHGIVSQAEEILAEEIFNALNQSRQRKQDLSEIVNRHVITALLKLVKVAKLGQMKSTHLERVVDLMAHSRIQPDDGIKRLVRQITEGNSRGSHKHIVKD